MILKLAAYNEQAFLESLDDKCEGMRPFVPSYYGLATVRTGAGLQDYLVLEQLGPGNPAACDIKMGFVQRASHHDARKWASMREKAATSTSLEYGFRPCGLAYYDWTKQFPGPNGSFLPCVFFNFFLPYFDNFWHLFAVKFFFDFCHILQYFDRFSASEGPLGNKEAHLRKRVKETKKAGRQVKGSGLMDSFGRYFNQDPLQRWPLEGPWKAIVLKSIATIERLQGVVQELEGVRFWGASLLFMMDTDVISSQDAKRIEESFEVKLIDFSNAVFLGEGFDAEIFYALENLKSMLQAMLRRSTSCPQPTFKTWRPNLLQQDAEQRHAMRKYSSLKEEGKVFEKSKTWESGAFCGCFGGHLFWCFILFLAVRTGPQYGFITFKLFVEQIQGFQ